MDPDQTALLGAFKGESDLGPHCLHVCRNMFEKFARRCSRRHIQTTFSDAIFLGILRVNYRVAIPVCLPVHLLVIHCKRAYNAPLAKLLFLESVR